MPDRLLSDEERYKVANELCGKCDAHYETGCIHNFNECCRLMEANRKAQDTKTAKAVNEDWVKWIEDNSRIRPTGIADSYNDRRRLDIRESNWQERKKEIGL